MFVFLQDLTSFYPYYLCEHIKPRTKVVQKSRDNLKIKKTLSALPFHCNIQCNGNIGKTDFWQVCTDLTMFLMAHFYFTLHFCNRTEWSWLAAGLLQVLINISGVIGIIRDVRNSSNVKWLCRAMDLPGTHISQ